MVQIYFLSVVCNFFSGLILSATFLAPKVPMIAGFGEIPVRRSRFAVGFGIITLLAGVSKFIFTLADDVPVVGDLLPALGGLWLGAVLLFQALQQSPAGSGVGSLGEQGGSEISTPFGRVLSFRPEMIGMIGMIVAIVHFLFPRVVLL